jgi:hypothetical protein
MLGIAARTRIAGSPTSGGIAGLLGSGATGIRNGAIDTARSTVCVCASQSAIEPPSDSPTALTVLPSPRTSANASAALSCISATVIAARSRLRATRRLRAT